MVGSALTQMKLVASQHGQSSPIRKHPVATSGVFEFKSHGLQSNSDIPELNQTFGFNADGKVESIGMSNRE